MNYPNNYVTFRLFGVILFGCISHGRLGIDP